MRTLKLGVRTIQNQQPSMDFGKMITQEYISFLPLFDITGQHRQTSHHKTKTHEMSLFGNITTSPQLWDTTFPSKSAKKKDVTFQHNSFSTPDALPCFQPHSFFLNQKFLLALSSHMWWGPTCVGGALWWSGEREERGAFNDCGSRAQGLEVSLKIAHTLRFPLKVGV